MITTASLRRKGAGVSVYIIITSSHDPLVLRVMISLVPVRPVLGDLTLSGPVK